MAKLVATGNYIGRQWVIGPFVSMRNQCSLPVHECRSVEHVVLDHAGHKKPCTSAFIGGAACARLPCAAAHNWATMMRFRTGVEFVPNSPHWLVWPVTALQPIGPLISRLLRARSHSVGYGPIDSDHIASTAIAHAANRSRLIPCLIV